MPNWETHLAIAKRVNKYLKFNNEYYEIYMFANILPDINNGKIVEASKHIPHDFTHLKTEEENGYLRFYRKYRKNLISKDPLYWGYFLHLYTDYIWNNNFYSGIKRNIKTKKDTFKLKDIKHNDFNIYNNKFIPNHLSITNKDKLLTKISEITEVSIKNKDFDTVLNYLLNNPGYKGNYKYYTENKLNSLYNYTAKSFINRYIFRNNKNKNKNKKKVTN